MKKNLLGISLITITSLYCLLAAVIILITLLTDIPVLYGIITSIVILILQFIISPYLTDLCMKWFYHASFDVDMPEYLKNFITEVCNNHQMSIPRIGYIEDGAPNAFTYGHTKNDARVVLTKGIFDLLSEEEVKAVVAHELGHASHYDMLFMTVAQLVPLVLYAIYEIFRSRDNDNDDKGYGALISAVAYLLYIISNYIVLGLSRTREYYADSFSIEETKNPNALASALVKVGYGLAANSNTKSSHNTANALGIFDAKTSKSLIVSSYDDGFVSRDNIKQAMKWEQWNIWAKWYELNSTHPLISKRLLAISKRCGEYNQEPFITFDLEKPESYLDDFLLEVLISFLPSIIVLLAIAAISFAIVLEYENILLICGISLLALFVASYWKFRRRYSSKPFENRTVKDLLSEVKVSHITSIPCTLEGTIIGRGNPGCIFNEDFIIKDSTGIVFLDYNQPIRIVNKIFALFKSPEYFNKNIKVTGWYRRSPVPYVEIKTMEIDGQEKKVYTYGLTKGLYLAMGIASIVLIILSFL